MSASNTAKNNNGTNVVSDVLIGISDGLIIPFAISVGLCVLLGTTAQVWVAGLIILCAGAIVMGFGGYFAAKDRQQSFASRTDAEELALKKAELEKTVRLFKQLNLGTDMQEQAAEEIDKDSKEWKAYLQQHMGETDAQEMDNAGKTAVLIAISFIAGGIIPLIPYALLRSKDDALLWSAAMSLLAVFIVGFAKSKQSGEAVWWGTMRLFLMGGAAAAMVYLVAKIFAA